MTDYEVEFGPITERRNVKTGDTFAATVEVHVQRADTVASPVGTASTGSYEVVFDVDEGVATFRELDGEGPFNDLALVAARAAAHELADSSETYAVTDPITAVDERDYDIFDQLP